MTPPGHQDRWRLYTPEEAVPILHMSKATIYRRVAGGLPHHRIGGLGVMFTAEDIDLILAQSAKGRR